MQAFDALFGGQRAGSARNTTPDTSRASNAQDDAGSSGGFDRMLQAQGPRNVVSNPSPRTNESPNASTQAKAKGASRDTESPRASEESKSSETKSNETKSDDASREAARTGSKDDAPGDTSDGAQSDAAANASEDTTAASDAAAPATTAASSDAATPALPEQMLALLNGLAGASAAPAATAGPTEALPPGLLRGDAIATATDPRGGTAAATAPVLPTLSGAQAAAPTDGDATAAFAMAMGAAASADTKTPGATDTAALDAIGIGDATSTSASLPSVSTTNHPLPRGVAASVQANTPIPLDNGFDDGFSSRIAWLADQKIGHAEIRITPDHLGAIDVRLQLDGNRVNAEFHSAQPDVRHALESSLPRLRDMLGQQGLQLGQADVGQRQAQQQGASNGQPGSFANGNERGEAATDAGWSRGPAVRASRGLLDEYA